MTNAKIKAVNHLRRSHFAGEIRAIIDDEITAVTAQYTNSPAAEATRIDLVALKRVRDRLFTEPM